MERYLGLILLIYRVISGEKTMACRRLRCSRLPPQAVLEPPRPRHRTKGWIQLWSDTLRHVTKACCFEGDHLKCILPLYLLSVFLSHPCLSQVSDSYRIKKGGKNTCVSSLRRKGLPRSSYPECDREPFLWIKLFYWFRAISAEPKG